MTTNIHKHKRSKHSVSLPKRVFHKQSVLNYDALDSSTRLMMYKSTKGSLKGHKRSSVGFFKKGMASSKLSKHIEAAFGYKSNQEKKLGVTKSKQKSRFTNLPLPIINTK